ncbi:MAG: peptide-binding protein [Thermodesulfobacteriota bacterium]
MKASAKIWEISGRMLLVWGVFVLLSCPACSPSGGGNETLERPAAAGPPCYGDTLITGSIGEPSNLIPILASDSSSHEVAGLIYNGLVKYDKDLKLVGDLAESFEVSKSGLVITFHLRKGVRWHDGQPFTAADVLFTYKTMVDPHTPTAYAEDFLQVERAEATDPYTFRVTYKKPFAPALASWGISILPGHLLEGRDIMKSPLARRPVGTGPFIFKEWKAGEKVVLAYNPDYFEGRPYIDRYIYRIIPDSATMFMELKAGGIDNMGLSPLQYARQTEYRKFKENFNKYRYPAFAYTYLGFNLEDEKFRDRRVRQAISYAINRGELIEGVLLGLGQEATGPYKPGTWACNPDVKQYPYNPVKARELLQEAGWRDADGDGILDKGGMPFRFTIITNQGNDTRARTAEIMQRRLKEVGIDVKIRIIEWAAFIKEFIEKKAFEATILGWTISQDPDIYDVWHSSKTRPGELNFISYRNTEVDALLEKGRRTFDQEERRKIYWRIQEILAEEAPYVFLYVPDALPVVQARVRGIEPAAAGITYNLIKWYVPKKEQRYKIIVTVDR